MKYHLTSLKGKLHTQLMLENITPARTRHIKGYGNGVTFTSKCHTWQQNATFATPKLLQYSDPTVITQF
jgi:hypothetical protein